ncbi:MAG TPA: leucyl/phenylalanyl-tRNA--protein transferase [Ilumatobacteraceae bacterium]|nr:leucyl/phenylalanyl-tRNA--protein transferase [Ilumatobacteraceae bacterium]
MFATAPIEPPPTQWRFPPAFRADKQGLVAVGADLEPGTLLTAYRSGLFPMPVSKRAIGWWSPNPRGVLPLDGLRITKSLRQSRRRYRVEVDTCFSEVMRRCADPSRPGGWITHDFIAAYSRLHALGWAHSVETYDEHGALVGGLYGVRIDGLFAGESMFSTARDASKVALAELVEQLRAVGVTLLDVQWTTPHLVSLGARDIGRDEYLRLLDVAVGNTGRSIAD